MIPLPSPSESALVNAARLVRFAQAAYLDHPTRAASKRKRFKEHFLNGDFHWLTNGSSCCLLFLHNDVAIVAISGSNDRRDWGHNIDYGPMSFGEWARPAKIPIDEQAKDVHACGGFLSHAALVHHSLKDCAAEIEVRRKVYVTGHSLGGAVAEALQMWIPLQNSECYTFGSPRLWYSPPVQRMRIAVRHAGDAVTYAPPRASHASNAETIYLGSNGQVRPNSSIRLRSLLSVCGAAWATFRVLRHVYRRMTLRPSWSFLRSHSVEQYRTDLSYFME